MCHNRTIFISGGNQRDLAREKNQKKQLELAKRKAANDKGSNKGMSLEQRKQRYVEVLMDGSLMIFLF